jgi:hypothetical protein
MRAPIFYDSDDTGFYVDPNGTSNLRKFSAFTMAYNGMNPMSANSPYVDRYNGSVGYRNGTMGYGTTDFNTIAYNWGSGFIDSWTNPANSPGGSSHYIGLQGVHYSDSAGNFYGFQMACAGEAVNRFFWRSSWPTMRSWVEMIHSGNIGSQSVASATDASTLGGYGRGNTTNKIAYFDSVRNLYVNDPESYTGEVRLGAAWGRGGVYASSTLSLSTSGTETHFVFNNSVPIIAYSTGQIDLSGSSTTPINITGASHKYLTINPGNGYEAMVRYIGGTGSSWYVGKRTSAQLIGTESFHFYSEAAGATVGGINPSGDMIVTSSYQLNNGFTISKGNSAEGKFSSWVQLTGSAGLYSNTNSSHIYANNGSYGSWKMDGIRNGWNGIEFGANTGNVSLMVNPSSNTTGFHNNAYGWQFYWEGGTLYCSKNAYGAGTNATVLDSVNYTSYAPTLTGGGASGTWGISITGSAASSGRSSSLDIVGYGDGNMTYYQSSGTFAGQSGWAGYFISNHGNGSNYYNQTIIMRFWAPPQYSRLEGGTLVGPYTFWSTENLNDYAPNMNQYVRTTDNVTFNTTTSPTILVNGHSDNTKGYRIHNTSGSSVSAMFTNSSNQLVIAAGAVDQINLNKKVYVNGVALGVNVAPSATAGRIDASNDIVAFSSSDERLKDNITPIENALDKVKSLTGVEFDWKPEHKEAHGHEGHDTGIIAQQVLGVMPSAVRTNDTGYLAVRYEKLIGLLIEANKELAARVEELEKKIG